MRAALQAGHGHVTESYPANPTGASDGLAGVTTPDGRVTALMLHPDRSLRNEQLSWAEGPLGDRTPWARLFANARVHLG